MAEPKTARELIQDVAGGAVGGVAGFGIAKALDARDPVLVALLSGTITALMNDAVKILLARNNPTKSDAQKVLEDQLRLSREFNDRVRAYNAKKSQANMAWVRSVLDAQP
jgi:hypothetical protein